jgi:hypothetical protein
VSCSILGRALEGFGPPRSMKLRGADFRGTCKIPPTACLRGAPSARLITRALRQQPVLSRAQRVPRKGAVLFADSAEFCKSLFSLRRGLARPASAARPDKLKHVPRKSHPAMFLNRAVLFAEERNGI